MNLSKSIAIIGTVAISCCRAAKPIDEEDLAIHFLIGISSRAENNELFQGVSSQIESFLAGQASPQEVEELIIVEFAPIMGAIRPSLEGGSWYSYGLMLPGANTVDEPLGRARTTQYGFLDDLCDRPSAIIRVIRNVFHESPHLVTCGNLTRILRVVANKAANDGVLTPRY